MCGPSKADDVFDAPNIPKGKLFWFIFYSNSVVLRRPGMSGGYRHAFFSAAELVDVDGFTIGGPEVFARRKQPECRGCFPQLLRGQRR